MQKTNRLIESLFTHFPTSYSKTGKKKQQQKKRATCFATLLQNELISKVACFTTHKTNLVTLFVARQVRTWVVTRVTSLSQLVLQHYVAKQVARFFCPLYRAIFVYEALSSISFGTAEIHRGN